MLEFWNNYGLYLWGLTTALVVVALVWLAYNTFSGQEEETEAAGASAQALEALAERVTTLAEATPRMQATLGRTLQYIGLVRFADATGAQAFTLTIANARGDGFVLSSSVRGGLNAKPVARWAASQPLSREEQSAVEQAREQQEKT